MIRSSLELLSTTDADRPRGSNSKIAENSTENAESSTSNNEDSDVKHSDAKRPKLRNSMEDRENAMLPDLKPAPGIVFIYVVHLDFGMLAVNYLCAKKEADTNKLTKLVPL